MMNQAKENLMQLNLDNLKDLAKTMGLKGYSKLRKELLVDKLYEHFHLEETILAYLDELNCYEAESFYKLLMDRKLRLTSANTFAFRLPIHFGYMLSETEVDSGYTLVWMEDHFEDVFCAWWDSKGEEHIVNNRVVDYCIACCNLWGIAPVVKVVEALNVNCGSTYTKEEVLSIAKEYAALEQEDFHIVGDELIADDLEANGLTGTLRSQQGNEPFFIPSHEELLRYVYGDYYDSSIQIHAFKAYMRKNYGYNHEALTETFTALAYVHKVWADTTASLNVVMDYLSKGPYGNLDVETLTELAQQVGGVLLSIRTWCHRGYTTEEKTAMATVDINGDPVEEKVSTTKQGRNELCACGSGKKYKKCCGR